MATRTTSQSGQRNLIESQRRDKRNARQNEHGQFEQEVDVGPPLTTDRRSNQELKSPRAWETAAATWDEEHHPGRNDSNL
jgi:hypothetical protein